METPYFLIDEERFENNNCRFREALKEKFARSYIAYSVKTNSLPWFIQKAYSLGNLIEVTSFDEYNLARAINIPVNKIVYNGPNKDRETFVEAVNGRAIVNIENFRELEWLMDCEKGSRVGIRLNVNLGKTASEDNREYISSTEEKSRFGLSFENGDFEKALNIICENGYELGGIHTHRTSDLRRAQTYRDICRYIKSVIDEYHLTPDYIDIGGGYWGDVSTKPQYHEYVNAFYEAFKDLDNEPCIIVEPGSAAVASCVDFVTSVLDTKVIDEEVYCTIDGSRLDVDPFFHKERYDYELLLKNESMETGEGHITTTIDISTEDYRLSDNTVEMQVIAGFTCLEKDILFRIANERPIKRGDKIVFHRVGAYTMTLTPNFIRTIPQVGVKKQDGTEVCVRNKLKVSQWIDNCDF